MQGRARRRHSAPDSRRLAGREIQSGVCAAALQRLSPCDTRHPRPETRHPMPGATGSDPGEVHRHPDRQEISALIPPAGVRIGVRPLIPAPAAAKPETRDPSPETRHPCAAGSDLCKSQMTPPPVHDPHDRVKDADAAGGGPVAAGCGRARRRAITEARAEPLRADRGPGPEPARRRRGRRRCCRRTEDVPAGFACPLPRGVLLGWFCPHTPHAASC